MRTITKQVVIAYRDVGKGREQERKLCQLVRTAHPTFDYFKNMDSRLVAPGMAQTSLSTGSRSHLLLPPATLVLPCTSRGNDGAF